MIDNQSTTLHEFIVAAVGSHSRVHLQCGNISFYGLQHLLSSFPAGTTLNVLASELSDDFARVVDHPSDTGRRTQLDLYPLTLQLLKSTSTNFSLKRGFCGVNLILIEEGDKCTAATFTRPDFDLQLLGLYPSEVPVIALPQTAEMCAQFKQLFEHTWDNAPSVTENFFTRLEEAVQLATPRQQYHFTLSHLFSDYERLIDQERIGRSGFFDSKIWKLLYNFQKDAVLGAIDKIEKYGGCIIADSVGLGKTFEALGVIKYYQQRNFNVLVLCPKRLYENWAVYRNPDRRNILIEDHFN